MIDIYWCDVVPNTIRIDVEADWTWEEFQKVMTRAIEMNRALIKKSKEIPRIDYILDFRYADFTPRPTFHLSNIHITANRQLPNVGIMAVMTNNIFIQTMFETCARVSDSAAKYFRVVPDLSNAEWLIAVSRATSDEAF